MKLRTMWFVLAALLVLPLAADCEAQAETGVADLKVDLDGTPLRVTDIEGVEQNLYLDGRVYVSGQPTKEALAVFRKRGVTAVVNLRTPSEMENRDRVPYDEAAAVADLGMVYVWIPLGGDDHPYTPEAVDRFAQVLADHEGAVLLHCTMGWRAAYLWVAYLVRDRGFSLEDGFARGREIAISPTPLEGFLDRPMKLVWAE